MIREPWTSWESQSLTLIEHMKIWHAVELEIDRVAETPVTTQLWNANTNGLEVSEETAEATVLRAYFNEAPDVDELKRVINRALKFADIPESALKRLTALKIEDQDWLSEWKKGYEPVEIGKRILICPSWKIDQVKDSERLIVQIDPGMAFGTGTHETTRGCLEMLERYWSGGSLLDVGTGTGILAIAAARLAPGSRVVGFDVDPEAIDVANENAEINHAEDLVLLEVNKLSSYEGQEFDVVLANLTADVIVPLASEFPLVTKPEGILILSGILREQGQDVLEAISAVGFEELEALPDGEWVTFATRRRK